ncbi:MAG: hypothetical protein Q7U08_09175 [Flavobacteriaceae bacterium]|nr:hypothetical protein [Flavobacteriaceae bacterium]
MKREEMNHIAPRLAALKLKPEVFKLPDGALEHTEISVLAELGEIQLKSKFGKENPFKVSTTYFEDFEDSIIDSLKNKSNSAKTKLKVPDDYFKNFEQQVLAKLQQPTIEKEVKVIALRSRFVKISASVAVAASLALFFIFNPFQSTEEVSFDALRITEIEAWIEADQLNLDAYQIASVYKEEKLKPNLFNSTVKEDELENFLNHANIDELMYE